MHGRRKTKREKETERGGGRAYGALMLEKRASCLATCLADTRSWNIDM